MKHKIFINGILVSGLLCLEAGCGSKVQHNADYRDPDKPLLVNHVKYLDPMLNESSGLITHAGKLWTINDSGGEPVLFALDPKTGKVLQAIRVGNAQNRDWESLAQDDDYIYVCDTGNNYGRRDLLTIYKLYKDSIPGSGNASFHAEIIAYRYDGRPENNPFKRSPYDCEAVIAYGDSLYLFTKDWETRSTTIYACSKTPGEYSIEAAGTFPADGLITGADMYADGHLLVLCGYRDYVPFLWFFTGYDPVTNSHESVIRFDYPGLRNLQCEGIAFESKGRVILSCELSELPAALYRLDLGPYVN